VQTFEQNNFTCSSETKVLRCSLGTNTFRKSVSTPLWRKWSENGPSSDTHTKKKKKENSFLAIVSFQSEIIFARKKVFPSEE